MPNYEFIDVSQNESITEIIINRPAVRNSLHPPASRELAEAFQAFEADSNQRVAIISGAGDQAFCAGNDVKFTISAKPEEMRLPEQGLGGLTTYFNRSKPVIAAVNGFALGGGFELAMACELIVASEQASFGLPEVKIGLAPLAGGIHRLSRAIPPKLALEMMLTGEAISAQQAKQLGVVNHVVAHDELLIEARKLAAHLIAGSPYSQKVILQALTEGSGQSLQDALALDTKFAQQIFSEGDYEEGINAFIEKRKPNW